MYNRTGTYIAVISFCLGPALFFEWVSTPSPSEKRIHIEAFRYGTCPSIIRSNRGDKLILTFSTRDTGHSFFLQDYRIDAKISPASEIVELRDPLRATEPPSYVRNVSLTAGLPGFWGSMVSASRFRCHVYCGPMHGFEQGDLIVRPNWLLAGSLGLLLALLIIAYWEAKRGPASGSRSVEGRMDLNGRFPLLRRMLKWRPLPFVFTLPVLAGFTVVLAAGLLGTKVGGRNIAVMLTWIVWISALALFLVSFGGRIWCMICPLPVLGEYLQRGSTIEVRPGKKGRFGNRFFGLSRTWPRFLRGPWLRLLLFFGLSTLSASLAGQPRWTAITILSMVGAATVMALVWELRAFCRYVCPITSFISAYSPIGRLMVRNRDDRICRTCKERPCLWGNEAGWACPYGLLVPRIDRNTDCGLCTECFKSCPRDNVSLSLRKGPWKERFRTHGEAWQAIVLLVLAIAYSLTVHSPWPAMRDLVNLVDKASVWSFGLYFFCLGVLALGIVPLIFWLMCLLGLSLSREHDLMDQGKKETDLSVGPVFKRTMPALLPLGLALWAAFFVDTLMVNMTFILLSFSDPFGWGWDLFGTSGMPWVQISPSAIPFIQVVLVLLGLTLSLKKGFQVWEDETDGGGPAIRGFTPTAAILVVLAAGMIIYFANY